MWRQTWMRIGHEHAALNPLLAHGGERRSGIAAVLLLCGSMGIVIAGLTLLLFSPSYVRWVAATLSSRDARRVI